VLDEDLVPVPEHSVLVKTNFTCSPEVDTHPYSGVLESEVCSSFGRASF
jgi:hypothetical protein